MYKVSSEAQIPPKVFISYSHDSSEHMSHVRALSDRLCLEGVDSNIDQYEQSPPEGWPRWMVRQIREADFVLVVCTKTYLRRFEGEEELGRGLGGSWEGAILTQHLYEDQVQNTRFIPIVFSTQEEIYIPVVLRGVTRYRMDVEGEYGRLYRHLTNQPEVQKPNLGELRVLPPHDLETRSALLTRGVSDKVASRYGTLWTVFCILDVMDNRADSIRLEFSGEEEEGIEFRIRKGGAREYHRVKSQHGAQGHWTLNELGRNMVLSTFWDELNDPAARCVFVSSHPAHQLSELIESAMRAESWAEFDRELLVTPGQVYDFATLRSLWGNCLSEEAFERLRRISTKTIDKSLLSEMVEVRLETLIEGDPTTISEVLFRLALDRVHQELDEHDLTRHLEERSFRRRNWANDDLVLVKLEEANLRYLFPIRNELISRVSILREETNAVLSSLTSIDGRRGILLAGEAGVGKSGIVMQLLERLREHKVPILAFRVDRLDPTPLPDDIGRQLELPGSPVAVLASVAQGQECVLIIDQLDAVSLASGRHPQFFDGVHEVIKQAEAYPRMRLLVVCRKFDLDNDHRFRRLTDPQGVLDVVTVNRLPDKTVWEVVTAIGLEAADLSPEQVQLLSVPLHLNLLAEISETLAARNLDFRTAKDLFDRFWDRKRAVLRERTGRSVQWPEVIDILCDYMSERRSLSAPAETVDEHEEDAQAMASENVLVRDRDRYAFFHETFFDYAFARRFIGRERELLPFLREGEQHLFRRAQVRQILRHERDADRARYLDDLGELLHSSDIRFHIKQVVFALLAGLEDPTREEWNILAPLLEAREEPYMREIFNLLRSAPWFGLVDSLGLWERWLAEVDEERQNRVVYLLWMAQKHNPDRVAELLEPYVGLPAWHNRIAYVMSGADLHTNRRFFELFLKAIDEGILDEADLGVNLYDLPHKNAEWACEALYHYLQRRQERNLLGAYELFDPFSRSASSNYDEELFTKSARRAPRTFVTELLPFMLRLMEELTEQEGEPPYEGRIWRYRYPGESHSTEDTLLTAMEVALRTLAKNEPEAFNAFARLLHEKSDFETAQYLLVRSYAANGERYADEAVEYLLEKPARLETGYASDSHWATRQLLEAITPYCSDENMARLEELILSYYSKWELEATSADWRGSAQLTLLGGIAPSRLSPAAEARLEQWREKFGGDAKEPMPAVMGGFVRSPIPEESTKNMTDEEWLEAISRYPEDRHGR